MPPGSSEVAREPVKTAGPRWRFGLWVLVSSLLLTEVVVRLADLAPPLHDPDSWLVEDPVLPYRPAPGSRYRGRTRTDEFDFDYRHNRLGFRDEDHEIAKPEGTVRIVALGDSFTYGWGADYEATWLRRIETTLDSRPDRRGPVEVIKLGIPGYHPRTELLVWEHHGRGYDPDLVVVGVGAGDVVDTRYDMLDPFGGRLVDSVRRRRAALMGHPGRTLYLHWQSSRVPLIWAAGLRGYLALPDRFDTSRVYEAGGPFEDAWIETERRLTRLARATTDGGARLLVIYLPTNLAVGAERDAAARVRRWGERSGVDVVDTLPALREAEKSTRAPLYWPKDRHPTAEGYRVISRAVLARLASSLRVPGPAGEKAPEEPAG